MKILIVTTLALATSAPMAARADESTVAATIAATAPRVEDARLARMRGKFVPSATSPAAGTIVYFGLDMKTDWRTANAATYSADVAVRIGVSASGTPTLTITTDSAQQPARTAGTSPSSGAIVGGLPADVGGASGLVQSIQIAGNGNAVDNHAAVTVTSNFTATTVGTAGAGVACTACSFQAGPGGVGLSIALPGGNVASQSLGPGGVTQSARITSDGNFVANDLRLVLGVAHGGSAAAPIFVPSLITPVPTMVIR